MKTSIYLFLSLIAFNSINAASNLNIKKLKNTIYHTIEYGDPLCVAISKGDLETVKKLVEYGVDMNKKSNDLTPLMVAVLYNQIDIVKYLIDKGVDIKIKNERGNTALKIAQFNQLNEVAFLLKNELKKKTEK
ncbi:MAG: ankyrin repeat domain-containing protein [Flavobacterium sp.]